MHIIEELQLFEKPQPIESMVLSPALVCIIVFIDVQVNTDMNRMWIKIVPLCQTGNRFVFHFSITANNSKREDDISTSQTINLVHLV